MVVPTLNPQLGLFHLHHLTSRTFHQAWNRESEVGGTSRFPNPTIANSGLGRERTTPHASNVHWRGGLATRVPKGVSGTY
jgi:hypothetical protein